MHFIVKAQWAFTISILAITILQKILSDPVKHQKYETVRDTVCYPCTWLQSSKSPHFPGWGTWTNPSRWRKRGIITSPVTVIGTKKRLTEHEVLYKLGGNGPWSQRATPASPDSFPPESCRVEQVHMLSRHSERYPTRTAGSRHLALIERLKGLNVPLNGSLSFFNDGWTYFTDNPERDFEQLTSTGPYAGTLGSFTTGVRFRTRYGHLLPKPGMKMRLWASDSKRVIDTASYFASGLLGVSINWERNDIAEVDVIPETLDRGSDTLTPGDTCLRYIEDTVFGHDYGRNMLAQFQNAYIPPIARRLIDEEENQAVGGFTNVEIYSMQEMCGFETLARGSSPWCDVFTSQDWDHFEYARDLIHFYRAGPGNTYAGAMGWLWLNATSHLLEAGPDVGTTFFSFVHDGDIAPMLTALNIFNDPKYGHFLPVTHIAEDRVWRTATVMPMGGRITFERLHCGDSPGEHLFVRININDDIVSLPDCHDGPGGSCPLDQFVTMVHERRAQVGRFDDVCGTKEQERQGLSFLKQPSYQSLEDLRTFPSDLYSEGGVLQKVLKVDN